MGQRNMEKDKPEYKKIIDETIIILFVIVTSALLIAQVVINVMDEIFIKYPSG